MHTDGRTDGHFSKKFYFFLLIKNIYIYIYVYTYLDYFSNFTSYDIFLTKVSIPFFHLGNRYEKIWINSWTFLSDHFLQLSKERQEIWRYLLYLLLYFCSVPVENPLYIFCKKSQSVNGVKFLYFISLWPKLVYLFFHFWK